MLHLRGFVMLIFLSCHIDNGCSKISYDGYKLLEVAIDALPSVEELQSIQAKDDKVSFWSFSHTVGHKAMIMVAPDHYEEFSNTLGRLQLQFTTRHTDIGRLIKEQEEEMAVLQQLKADTFDLYNYHTYAEINEYLFDLVRTCNRNRALRCKKIKLGLSYEGRAMWAIKIGARKKRGQPAIWLDAGIHAREWIAPATALYIMNKLVSDYDSHHETRTLVNTFDWYILPCANPDGYVYSWNEDRLWRKTRSINRHSECIGTDPNRNFDFHWNEAGTSPNPCSLIYAGPKAFSELETRSIAYFLRRHRRVAVYLSLHSYSQLWLTPWGHTSDFPDDYDELVEIGQIGADAIARVFGTIYTVGSPPSILYEAAGSSMDWAKGVAGIKYSLTAELRDTGEYGFLLPARFIRPVGIETFTGIRAMMLAVADKLDRVSVKLDSDLEELVSGSEEFESDAK